jgi:hypothetical protein
MAEVASAYVALLPSARGWERDVGRQIDGGTTKAGKSAGARAGKVFGGSFSGAVKGVFAAAGGLAVGSAAVGFLKDSISEASDLNETVSKSNVIFGKNAKVIDKWAKGAATSIGLSHQAALESAASFGDMFSQIGIGGDRAAKMSKGVVQLAADLGSFNNLSTDDVLERIAGGFRGEYDALQKVIPNISAARVQQEALNRTHKKSVSQLTASEKAEATLAIIRKDGARATGDFARTSGGLANQQKILKARTDDLQAAVGKGLLPVTTKIVSKASEFVQQMQDGTGAGGDFVDVLTDARDVGKGVLAFFDAIPGPVKKYGIELAIGLVVMSKFRTGIGSLARAVTLSSTQMAAGVTRTQLAMVRLRSGMGLVAGAAGAVALTKSVHESSLAVASLERVGGGLAAGFAVGGPVGAAVGGTTGLLWTLKDAFSTNAKEVKVSLPSYREYAATLDGVSASTSKATRAMVLERLEKSGLLDATRKLGLSDRDAVSAITGNVAARMRLAEALRHARGLTDEQKSALEREAGAVAKSRQKQLEHNVAIAAGATELKKAKIALKNFMDSPASKKVTIDTAQAQASIKALSQGLREALGLTRDLNTAGPGGIDVLLNPTKPKKRRALGGPVSPNQPYIVNERGPEVFTSSQRGRLTPLSQLAHGGGVDAEQTAYRAFTRALSDTRTVITSRPSLEAQDLMVGVA